MGRNISSTARTIFLLQKEQFHPNATLWLCIAYANTRTTFNFTVFKEGDLKLLCYSVQQLIQSWPRDNLGF